LGGVLAFAPPPRGTGIEAHHPAEFLRVGRLITGIPNSVVSHLHQFIEDCLLPNLAAPHNRHKRLEVSDM
jgi:hypothetical protein